MTAQRTHVVVIGGGYAGTLAANHLRLRADVDITLVNPRPKFVERIRLHQFVARSGDATVDYGTLLYRSSGSARFSPDRGAAGLVLPAGVSVSGHRPGCRRPGR